MRRACAAMLLSLACGPKAAATTEPGARIDPKGSQRAAANQAELLGGSVVVDVPTGAEVSPRPHGVMGAPTPVEEETRVVLVAGKDDVAKFVLVAREGFVLGTGDARADAATYLGPDAEHLEIRPAGFQSPFQLALMVPEPDAPQGDGPRFVLGAVFERDDRSIFELWFVVLPELADQMPEYRARALHVLKSAAPGPGRLPVRRELVLDSVTGQRLTVTMPHPAVLTRQEGPDFVVYHAREMRGLDEAPGVLGVYFGGHPAFQHDQQQGDPPPAVEQVPGTLLGQSTDWVTWTMASGRTMAEAIVPLGPHDFMHVFMHAPADGIEALKGAAEGIATVAAAR